MFLGQWTGIHTCTGDGIGLLYGRFPWKPLGKRGILKYVLFESDVNAYRRLQTPQQLTIVNTNKQKNLWKIIIFLWIAYALCRATRYQFRTKANWADNKNKFCTHTYLAYVSHTANNSKTKKLTKIQWTNKNGNSDNSWLGTIKNKCVRYIGDNDQHQMNNLLQFDSIVFALVLSVSLPIRFPPLTDTVHCRVFRYKQPFICVAVICFLPSIPDGEYGREVNTFVVVVRVQRVLAS